MTLTRCRAYFNDVMLPLIAVGIAAAAAGWAGATLYRRLRPTREGPAASKAAPAETSESRDARKRSSRPLAWCAACSSYFVAGERHECAGPM